MPVSQLLSKPFKARGLRFGAPRLKLLITVLAVMFFMLQWRLWVGDGGVREVRRYQTEISRLSEQLEEQRDINSALRAEVKDLQNGLGEIEERARAELGMIGQGEKFYQFVGEKVDGVAGVTDDNLARITTEAAREPDKKVQ